MKLNMDKILKDHLKWVNNEEGGIRADLHGANLCGANLCGADLCGADLRGADLYETILCGANLCGAEELLILHTSICPEGTLIGWKRCKSGIIVKLEIPLEAKRSNATGRKCRAEFVKVLEIFGDAEKGISQYDNITEYKVGEIVKCNSWCEDRWQECAGGIHFFLTRLEAENY
jgi:hypothetical protein